jgi:hypothetical protein
VLRSIWITYIIVACTNLDRLVFKGWVVLGRYGERGEGGGGDRGERIGFISSLRLWFSV